MKSIGSFLKGTRWNCTQTFWIGPGETVFAITRLWLLIGTRWKCTDFSGGLGETAFLKITVRFFMTIMIIFGQYKEKLFSLDEKSVEFRFILFIYCNRIFTWSSSDCLSAVLLGPLDFSMLKYDIFLNVWFFKCCIVINTIDYVSFLWISPHSSS